MLTTLLFGALGIVAGCVVVFARNLKRERDDRIDQALKEMTESIREQTLYVRAQLELERRQQQDKDTRPS